MSLIAILCLGLLPFAGEPATELVDLIEWNHTYDGCGRKRFDQLLYFVRTDDGYELIDWRFVTSPAQTAFYRTRSGDYESIWQEASQNIDGVVIWPHGDITRRVRTKAVVETWTQYDPEARAQSVRPPEERRGLSRNP